MLSAQPGILLANPNPENMFVLRFCLFGGYGDDRVSLLSRNGLRYEFYVFNPIKDGDDRASSWYCVGKAVIFKV